MQKKPKAPRKCRLVAGSTHRNSKAWKDAQKIPVTKPPINSVKLTPVCDFPVMIEQLMALGYTLDDMAILTEAPRTQLTKTMREVAPIPSGWIQAWNIIDLYCRMIGTPVPLFGNHNPVKFEDENNVNEP